MPLPGDCASSVEALLPIRILKTVRYLVDDDDHQDTHEGDKKRVDDVCQLGRDLVHRGKSELHRPKRSPLHAPTHGHRKPLLHDVQEYILRLLLLLAAFSISTSLFGYNGEAVHHKEAQGDASHIANVSPPDVRLLAVQVRQPPIEGPLADQLVHDEGHGKDNGVYLAFLDRLQDVLAPQPLPTDDPSTDDPHHCQEGNGPEDGHSGEAVGARSPQVPRVKELRRGVDARERNAMASEVTRGVQPLLFKIRFPRCPTHVHRDGPESHKDEATERAVDAMIRHS
mmetsp:Transcript_12166/g.32622  ORF Transcript_12166/g.32622 Transcript_12166/m.32622 type:complete len:283 (-) Transcript_12166:661-1509(-)